jgi:hypothetical protein
MFPSDSNWNLDYSSELQIIQENYLLTKSNHNTSGLPEAQSSGTILSPRFTLKGSVFFGQIAGADSTSASKKDQARNLSFKSNIFEFSGQLEFNLVPYDVMNKKGKFKRIIPCVYTGLAVYKYNPLAKYKGGWWELQTLGTEGQGTTQFQSRKKYSLTQISIPVGIGLKNRLFQKA